MSDTNELVERIAEIIWNAFAARIGGDWPGGDSDLVAVRHSMAVAAEIAAIAPVEAVPVEPIAAFGNGSLVVDTGTVHDLPAVFVRPAVTPGQVGEQALGADHQKGRFDHLAPGEFFMTFPTDEQARRVADALVNAHPLAQAGAVTEADIAQRAKKAADAIGVTPYSDMRIFVEQAVKYALTAALGAQTPPEGAVTQPDVDYEVWQNGCMMASSNPRATKALREAADELHENFKHPTKGIEALRKLTKLRQEKPIASNVAALVDELADAVDAAWKDIGGCRSHREILNDIRAALMTTAHPPAQAGAVTEAQGWRLVPQEPSDAMLSACMGLKWPGEGWHATAPDHRVRTCAADVWRAMLAAAPTPPVNQSEGADR